MKIKITTDTPHNNIFKLLIPFLELNEESDFDYFEQEDIYVRHNWNSGYSYIYLESSPSLSLAYSTITGKLSIIYASSLDGLEFEQFGIPDDMQALENLTGKAYDLEDEIRGQNYENDELTEQFITAMESAGWEQL